MAASFQNVSGSELFLKYLPAAAKSLSEAAKNTADTYKSYQEGALTRENRKRLREEVKKDVSLQQLDANRVNQLVLLLDALQEKEAKQLPAPVRFAQEEVKSVELVVNRKD